MWTRGQRTILALTPKFSSVLTFLGSSWVITEVVTSKQKMSHPYHRLLLMMSVYDATEAIGNFMSTWPIPPETTYGQVWAAGNQQACSTQGFVLMLAIAVPIYNAMLALYYMLVINHNVTDRSLRLYFEPFVHAVAFAWAFGTAITAAVMGMYNNSNLWCWIAPLPHDCLDSWRYGKQGNCVRGDNAWIYRWAFYFAPLWLCILIASTYKLTRISLPFTTFSLCFWYACPCKFSFQQLFVQASCTDASECWTSNLFAIDDPKVSFCRECRCGLPLLARALNSWALER
jgi:hypothetical protein